MKRLKISEFMDRANGPAGAKATIRTFTPETFRLYAIQYRKAMRAARNGEHFYWEHNAGLDLAGFGVFDSTTAQCGVFTENGAVVEVVRRVRATHGVPSLYDSQPDERRTTQAKRLDF